MDQIDDILNQDLDPTETREWVESLNAVINHDGTERAHFLLERMVDSTRRSGGYLPFDPTTEYVNTIPPHMEARSPGNAAIEWRIRSLIRWNAAATSPASPPRRPCTTSASTTFGALRAPSTRVTWCSTRAIRRRACTRAPS